MSDAGERIIRASELAQYAFCARAWWLGSVLGLASANREELAAGSWAHRRHGGRVRAAGGIARLAYALLGLAALIALLGLLRLLAG